MRSFNNTNPLHIPLQHETNMKTIIIGGGFAGLSAAVHLTKQGKQATLLEASPKLGGRAYSFRETNNDCIIDNGQHIMMGCYHATLELLDILGAQNTIEIQKNLTVCFTQRGGKTAYLKTESSLYPFNLLMSMLKYSAVPFRKRLEIVSFFARLYFTNINRLKPITVKQWLSWWKQSDLTTKALWEILAIGTMNTRIEDASAYVFADVLKKIFFAGNTAAKIVIPKTGLSGMYCAQAEQYIKDNGGNVRLSEKVERFETDGSRITKVVTDKNEYTGFDNVISAVPSFAYERLVNERINLKYSPILTVHIWLTDNPFDEEFYGLIDSGIHWLFNKGTHITLVTSAAAEHIGKGNDEIMDDFCSELEDYFPIFYRRLVRDYKVIKEKRATFVTSPDTLDTRGVIAPKYANLYLAGDWTNTGLPATIEGAVLSGKKAAEDVIRS